MLAASYTRIAEIYFWIAAALVIVSGIIFLRSGRRRLYWLALFLFVGLPLAGGSDFWFEAARLQPAPPAAVAGFLLASGCALLITGLSLAVALPLAQALRAANLSDYIYVLAGIPLVFLFNFWYLVSARVLLPWLGAGSPPLLGALLVFLGSHLALLAVELEWHGRFRGRLTHLFSFLVLLHLVYLGGGLAIFVRWLDLGLRLPLMRMAVTFAISAGLGAAAAALISFSLTSFYDATEKDPRRGSLALALLGLVFAVAYLGAHYGLPLALQVVGPATADQVAGLAGGLESPLTGLSALIACWAYISHWSIRRRASPVYDGVLAVEQATRQTFALGQDLPLWDQRPKVRFSREMRNPYLFQ